MILTMVLIVIPTAAIWAAGGTALHRLTTINEHTAHSTAHSALLLTLSIAFIWI